MPSTPLSHSLTYQNLTYQNYKTPLTNETFATPLTNPHNYTLNHHSTVTSKHNLFEMHAYSPTVSDYLTDLICIWYAPSILILSYKRTPNPLKMHKCHSGIPRTLVRVPNQRKNESISLS